MQLFYTPNVTGNSHTLSEEESKHCIRVLRLTEGDNIALVDGKGTLYKAAITDPHPKRCSVAILSSEKEFGKTDYYLHIAIAPTKSIDRLEWFLEKATELGIDEISLLQCERSERKTVKPERLERVLIAAMKQSYRAYLPRLNPMVKLSEFIRHTDNESQRFIAHCNKANLPLLQHKAKAQCKTVILIGPEGDFSPEEVSLCTKAGFIEIGLGNFRLRTETAGIAACHTIGLINQYYPE